MISYFKLDKLYKLYIFRFLLFLAVILSICMMFFVQFKTDNLQVRLNHINSDIKYLKDEVKTLEIEWVYLTRPERLEFLSNKYLKNKNVQLSQIKTLKEMKVSLANRSGLVVSR